MLTSSNFVYIEIIFFLKKMCNEMPSKIFIYNLKRLNANYLTELTSRNDCIQLLSVVLLYLGTHLKPHYLGVEPIYRPDEKKRFEWSF